jgi:hypothetical protein
MFTGPLLSLLRVQTKSGDLSYCVFNAPACVRVLAALMLSLGRSDQRNMDHDGQHCEAWVPAVKLKRGLMARRSISHRSPINKVVHLVSRLSQLDLIGSVK